MSPCCKCGWENICLHYIYYKSSSKDLQGGIREFFAKILHIKARIYYEII